jgi:ParB family transcriptional regulator, chromosome partitioning protein
MVTTGTSAPAFIPNQLYDMPLADLHQDPNQPRKYLDPAALDELTSSIKEHNVIEPVVFRVENGICYNVAGDRRCAAALRAGLTTIPAIYTEDPRYEEIAITENTIRADLTAVEEAEALDRLQKRKSYKQEDLARIMGKSVTTISQTLSLNRLPQAIRDECRKDPVVPKRVLIEIAVKKQERSMVKAYEAYKASVNPGKKEKKVSDATPVQGALKAVQAAQMKVEDLNAGDLSQEEKDELVPALNGLKGAVETLLAAFAEPAPATTTKKKKTLA